MKKREFVLSLLLNAILIVALIYGYWIESQQGLIYLSSQGLLDLTLNEEQTMPPSNHVSAYTPEKIESLIHIATAGHAQKVQKELMQYLWSDGQLPRNQPNEVVRSITDERYRNIENLDRIDKITVRMDEGFDSIAYHFHPVKSNNLLVIYHHGHTRDFYSNIETVEFFINHGYSVIALAMPLYGLNPIPTLELDQFGEIPIARHDQMEFLKSKDIEPFKIFLEPVAVVMNYVEKEYAYDLVNMVGISGGGWTTTVYAAFDERMQGVYPVAGTLPFYLRAYTRGSWGDYEQVEQDFYTIANYLDLYILGSLGADRQHLQILNEFDSCCFSGTDAMAYEPLIQEHVKNIGAGSFSVYIDSTEKDHIISQHAHELIDKNIQQHLITLQ